MLDRSHSVSSGSTGSPAAAEAEAFFAYRERWKTTINSRLREATRTPNAELGECVDFCLARQGKLIRPVLTLVAAELAGGAPEGALDYACAIELTHLSSLVLDDLPCMDDSPERRGGASLHARFGEARAVLTGVFLLCAAFRLVAESGAQSSRAVSALASCVADNGMIVGQIKDLLQNGDPDVIRDLKTGTLIEMAAALGVLAVDGDDTFLPPLAEIARGVGHVLQMRDDVIDGQAEGDCQARAKSEAYALARRIHEEFGDSPAASALSSLAVFTALREY